MAKRQFDDSALLPRKKAKLHAIHDDDNPNTQGLHSPSPPPLTLAGFERREKRKRSLDLQPDTSEEPKAKQARRSQSPEESSDTHSIQFELLDTDEDEDNHPKSDPWREFCIQSTREAEEYLSTVRICRCRNHQTRLLSPSLSNEDTTDEDVADEGATGSNQLGFPTIHPSATECINYPRPIARKQPHASRTLRKRDTTTPQRKRRQPLKKDKEESKQNKSRDKAIEAFLSSKRSSRRSRDCTLWQLGDDGMACTISIAR
ncbi:uncharacterized protein Triagg1_2552 [Trichoderma aggressivum f. europaeum]|uniref:Uncharacterized protein n=1 Tax=Trichoderma aggressivum f. europaeum TaxID=173218 RepID=A0AAE1M3C1_9HYPO|nr:hypothetical protein Triagg1_2552 [Trichoderma aggressivum f. europaeum]